MSDSKNIFKVVIMKFYFIIFLIFTITGCQMIDEEFLDEKLPIVIADQENTLEMVLSSLVSQLVSQDKFDYKNQAMVVTTFVWADTLTYKNSEFTIMSLGHLLADSIKFELVQRGSKVIEHRSSNSISVSNKASYFLSRDLDELTNNIDISYVIAGTLFEVEKGVMVHAEAIDIHTKEVIGSARSFIPNQLLSSSITPNAIIVRDGQLYRNESARPL